MLLSEIIYILLLYGGGICFFVFMSVFAYSKLSKRDEAPASIIENEQTPHPEEMNRINYNTTLYTMKRETELIHKENERRLAEIEHREKIIRSTARYTVVNQQDNMRYRNASFYY